MKETQDQLDAAVQDVKSARDRLQALVASRPARDVETGPEDIFGEYEATTDLRFVAECVIHALEEAIASLESVRFGSLEHGKRCI